MKFLSFLLLFISVPVLARPHLDPEMTGREYLNLLEKMPQMKSKDLSEEDQEIEEFLSIGKRNLQWVDLVNSVRDPSNRISLSSIATQPGNAVSSPRFYNFRIIKDRWNIVKALLPAPLKKVLLENAPMTTETGVTDREFIEWLFQVDGAYQIAARYKTMKPWQTELAQGIAQDVRGYLNIIEEENIDEKLKNFDWLSELEQNRILKNLSMICLNSNTSRNDCSKGLKEARSNSSLIDFKNEYLSAGKTNYDAFFNILGSRPDGAWTASDPNNMYIPFADPHNQAVYDYLKINIEDEWKFGDWQLHLNFVVSTDPTMTHVVFEPGATPHVESAPGSIITMDQNAPLTEYDVQWTIRHEYGHILGFPDCYHEFYDEEQQAFVSYQLDVTNLMCSRRGKLKQIHFDELKKAYFKD